MNKITLSVKGQMAEYIKNEYNASSVQITSKIIPYSTAAGLLLNVCGIDFRNIDNSMSSLGMEFEMALANVDKNINVGRMLSQHHVSKKSEDKPENKLPARHYLKHKVSPEKIEFIYKPFHIISVRSKDNDFIDLLSSSILHGNDNSGILYLGNNECLVDCIEIVSEEDISAHWYIPFQNFDEDFNEIDFEGIESLTYYVNQKKDDNKNINVYPVKHAVNKIPEKAWVEISL